MLVKAVVLACALGLCSASVYAQNGVGAVEDSFRQDFRNVPYPRDNTSDILNENEILKSLPVSEETFRIKAERFLFRGNRAVGADALRLETSAAEGRSLTLEDLNSVADRITRYYRSLGYITSYAYLPPQVVENGEVSFYIVEGSLGEITADESLGKRKKAVLAALEPLKSEIILNGAELERRMKILNGYAGANVRAALKPGSERGRSDLVLTSGSGRSFMASVYADNYGSSETSKYRIGASLAAGSLLFSGDTVKLFLSMGLDRFNPEELFFGGVDYGKFFGSSGFKVGAAYYRTNYVSTGDFSVLDLRGYSDRYSIYLEYPVFLEKNFSLNLRGEFRAVNSTDKILGEKNTADGVYALSLGAYGDYFPWRGGAVSYALVFDQGINPLFHGSHKSGGSSRPDAGGLFERVYAEAVLNQGLLSFLRFNLKLTAQYASGALFSSEKFYAGGYYGGRGFENGAISGDNGYKISAELEADAFFTWIKVLVFYDRGEVQNYSVSSSGGYSYASLDSTGAGVRVYPWRGIFVSADYGVPIAFSRGKKDAGTFYARIGYDF